MTRRFRLVRNMAFERYHLGRPSPYAPLYDFEEVDDLGIPLRTIATGLPAEEARTIIGACEHHLPLRRVEGGIEDRTI